MRTSLVSVMAGLVVAAGSATAQPFVNGEAENLYYGYPEPLPLWIPPAGGNFGFGAVQDTQTDYGDADRGRPDVANGSELDAAYGTIVDGTLYLVFAGNFENNGNELVVFLDTRDGGQNQLAGPGVNPDIDFGALDRMGPQADDPETEEDESQPGLKFTDGFAADYVLLIKIENSDPVDVQVNYAELFDAVNAMTPVGYYMGRGQARCAEAGGVLADADAEAPFEFLASLDNSNTAGVTGGDPPGIDDGSGVFTGLELAIPLEALGNPTGAFELTAFITSGGNDDISSQVLGGLLGDTLGDPASTDLSTTFHLPVQVDPNDLPGVWGACCDGTDCTETTAANCAGSFSPGVPCDGNPCDATPAGACCLEDGLCEVLTEADCIALQGLYQGDGTDCLGCACVPPPTGACAVESGAGVDCFITDEADCLAQNGVYGGDFSECTAFGIDMPHVAGSLQDPEWVPDANPMDPTDDSNVWELTFTGLEPNTRYEFKITDGSWDNTFPGPNSWLFTDGNGEITITYDTNIREDGWLPNVQRLILSTDPGTWTAAGGFQGWDNANPETAMTEISSGSGIYRYETTTLEPGDYEWKPVVTGSWDSIGQDNRSINTGNMPFSVAETGDTVRLYVDAFNARVRACDGGTIGDTNCDGAVDFFDIDPFVTALVSGQSTWEASFGCDFLCANDLNGDLEVDFFDIDPFVALLVGN